MALQRPGSASKIGLMLSGVWTVLMLLSLIAGHLVLVVFLFLYLDQGTGMEVLVNKTGAPSFLLWASIVISVFMDGWIFLSGKKNKENVRRR